MIKLKIGDKVYREMWNFGMAVYTIIGETKTKWILDEARICSNGIISLSKKDLCDDSLQYYRYTKLAKKKNETQEKAYRIIVKLWKAEFSYKTALKIIKHFGGG